MRNDRLVQTRCGHRGVVVVVGEHRAIQRQCSGCVLRLIRRARRPVPPARRVARGIGHRGNRTCDRLPVAGPERGSGLPLERGVIEVGKLHFREVAQRCGIAVPGERQRQCECVRARGFLIQIASLDQRIETRHGSRTISARELRPSCEHRCRFERALRIRNQIVDAAPRVLQQGSPLQPRIASFDRQLIDDLTRKAPIAFRQGKPNALLDERGRQSILRTQPFERDVARRQRGRGEPLRGDFGLQILGSPQCDSAFEAPTTQCVRRRGFAVVLEKEGPLLAGGEAFEPGAPHLTCDRFGIVGRKKCRNTFIDSIQRRGGVQHRLAEPGGLQIRIERIRAQCFAVRDRDALSIETSIGFEKFGPSFGERIGFGGRRSEPQSHEECREAR